MIHALLVLWSVSLVLSAGLLVLTIAVQAAVTAGGRAWRDRRLAGAQPRHGARSAAARQHAA